MKHTTLHIQKLDQLIMDQILPDIRAGWDRIEGIKTTCWCLTGVDPSGNLSFFYLDENWTPSYFEKVSEFARFLRASKVLVISHTWKNQAPNDASLQINPTTRGCPNGQRALVIYLIQADGSVEWTITQSYRINGKRIEWEEPQKTDGGSQDFLRAWGSLATAN